MKWKIHEHLMDKSHAYAEQCKWLVQMEQTLGHRLVLDSLNSHYQTQKEATTLLHILYFVLFNGVASKWHFVSRLLSGSPKTRTFYCPLSLEPHMAFCFKHVNLGMQPFHFIVFVEIFLTSCCMPSLEVIWPLLPKFLCWLLTITFDS